MLYRIIDVLLLGLAGLFYLGGFPSYAIVPLLLSVKIEVAYVGSET